MYVRGVRKKETRSSLGERGGGLLKGRLGEGRRPKDCLEESSSQEPEKAQALDKEKRVPVGNEVAPDLKSFKKRCQEIRNG